MNRFALIGGLLLSLANLAVAEDQPLEATRSEEGVWTLAGQQWDFSAIASVYTPLKGTLDTKTGAAIWTLELAKELTSAEAATHNVIVGTPFKPSFLDEEKLLLAEDARVKITPLSGTQGDRLRMSVLLPKAAVLAQVKLVRVGRRTELGF